LSLLPYLVMIWIFFIGLYGIVTSRNLIHAITCLAVCQSSTYIFLLAIGYKLNAHAPIFLTISTHARAVDPVVQALTLTDIVVQLAVSSLLLSLVMQAHKRSGSLDPESLRSLQG
jgi:multicomponent Na+:H+ antiporter subunit C